MVKLLFLLMNEYRVWAMPHALETLERRCPGKVEGRVYSARDINGDPQLEQKVLEDARWADMVFLSSHGSVQNLRCFERFWEAREGKPTYFTSTMGDELAELLPQLGLFLPHFTENWMPIIRPEPRRIWNRWCCVP